MPEMHESIHYWTCDGELNSTEGCPQRPIKFRQPQLPQHDFRSEFNEEMTCPHCGETMYFCEEGDL